MYANIIFYCILTTVHKNKKFRMIFRHDMENIIHQYYTSYKVPQDVFE